MNAEIERGRNRSGFGKIARRILVAAVIIGIAAVIVVNRQWIYDWWRGINYHPSVEMVGIQNDLELTERGSFLFNATQPELNERDNFNNHCRDGYTETAVLGCYANDNIYIYNITEKQLDGIRELTTAHELLHVVFARMDDELKARLEPMLEQVYQDNQNILKQELDNYVKAEQFEELYVRAGTEIANLPEALERHYAEIFRNQDKVVSFYDGYIKVFRQLKEELEALSQEMTILEAEMTQATAEYEERLVQLNVEITNFNSCAETVGCFRTEAEFYSRRGVLMSEQMALEQIYNQISGLVDEYNAKVELYNADVLRNNNLNTVINSSSKPQELE